MDKLIEGLRHFRSHVMWERKEIFERSAKGQWPLAMLITCSDSRVLPDTLMQADPGDLFVHRNAGNLVPPPETPGGEGAAVEYAVTALGVTDIIVCGHYRCGAVRALLEPGEAESMPKVAEWLAHASDLREGVALAHPTASWEELWERAVEWNVRAQVENLSRHPVVAAGLAAGTLRLHAWVLRFESSDVLAYDPCSDSFTPLLDMPVVHPALPIDGPHHETAEPKKTQASERVAAVSPPAPNWRTALLHDLPSSIVVFLVALPLCLAIAKATGLPPEAGIVTGIIGGVLVGLLAGSPLQVSGPAAGLIVILIDLIQRFGVGRLGLIVLLAGGIQFLAGTLRMGRWFRAVSPAVVTGMLAGIGVVIFAQQFHVMVDDPAVKNPLVNLLNIPRAVWWGISDSHDDHNGHRQAALVGLLTLGILLVWPPLVRGRRLRTVPGVLVAVIVATTLAAALGWPVQKVEFDGLLTAFRFPETDGLLESLMSGSIWLAAGTVALVASAETLLCAAAVDRMHRGPRTQYDRELAAQGLGNVICGLLGSLPMTGVIVRSSANVQAGATSRWSAVLHGVWLLAFAVAAPGVLRLIPTAALAAILVLTGVKLVEVHVIRNFWRVKRVEAVICLATAATVVAVDLLSGVLLGIGLSVLHLIVTFARLRVQVREEPHSGRRTLLLEGCATFLQLPKLAAALEQTSPGAAVRIDLTRLSYIDHACLTLLTNWQQQHEESGGRLDLDWETLNARFRQARPRPRTAPRPHEEADPSTHGEA